MTIEEIVGQDVSLENDPGASNNLQELRRGARINRDDPAGSRPTFSYSVERTEILTTAKVNIYGEIKKPIEQGL